MENLNIPYIVRSVGVLSGVPVRAYRDQTLLCACFPVPLPRDPMEVCRREVFSIRDHAGYYVSPLFHYYGVVNAPGLRLVIGPTSQIMAGDQALRELAFRADVPKEEVPAFLAGMEGIVRMPVESLLQLLCSLNHILNGGEMLELSDIAIYEDQQTALKTVVERRRTARTYEEPPAPRETHNTLALEETLMDIVARGDTAALKGWLAAAPPVRGGTIAADQLRQLRNLFIVTVTLASRAAIRGGMAEEDAFAMSDGYIRRAELLTDPGRIMNLQYHMLLEYTEQVERLHLGGRSTRLAADVAGYVRRHLSEPVSVERMAEAFYMSRPYLSARFRQETGETLTDFILREKTEEAKRLLRWSEKSLTAIGDYLGFSSQSHFSRVFKRYMGVTPGEYRQRCRT